LYSGFSPSTSSGQAQVCPSTSSGQAQVCPSTSSGLPGGQVRHKSQKEKAKELATERALDKYEFFVFGLTIAITLY